MLLWQYKVLLIRTAEKVATPGNREVDSVQH